MTVARYDNSEFALCGDIGGTQMRGAIVRKEGSLVARDTVPTDPKGGIESAAKRFSDMLLRLVERNNVAHVKGMGISSAGPMRPWNGEYVHPPSLHTWHGKSLKPLLEEYIGISPVMGHDATLSALAETKFGRHKSEKNLLYITISTGIGGGAIVDGKLLTGAHGLAGEMGHMLLHPGGRRCNVGCNGCFEGNAAGPAIVDFAQKKVADTSDSLLLDMANGEISAITSKMVVEAAVRGDSASKEVVYRVIDTIGMGIASLLSMFDPAVILLGGGVISGLLPFWDDIKESIKHNSLPRYLKVNHVPVEMTSLGDDAGILGASVLVFDEKNTT